MSMYNIKFPRISHFPFSPQVVAGQAREDRVAALDWDHYLRKHGYVVMEKMDGSNVCLTREGVYPRGSGVLAPETFDWLKAKHAEMGHLLHSALRIYGENMYAVHSIEYKNLENYFYVFAVYDTEYRKWYSPVKVATVAADLEFGSSIKSVNRVPKTEDFERDFEREYRVRTTRNDEYRSDMEGFVVWANTDIPAHMFSKMVFKWVRQGHVQTDEHWTRKWKKAKLGENKK